ncbi:MAG TPA: hypothetical protein VHQ70_05365 [Syntrophomonadaceae bacterium]|nr:hypothetical protein [Syntrophomonadaceae bacterium]
MDHLSKLLDRKQEIEEALAHSRGILQTPISEYTDELSLYDQHYADTVSMTYEREKTAGMAELLEIELEKTNRAIEQYKNNQYGICELCRQPIEQSRLERLVNTNVCDCCEHNTPYNSVFPEEKAFIPAGDLSDYGEVFR